MGNKIQECETYGQSIVLNNLSNRGTIATVFLQLEYCIRDLTHF